MAEILLDPLSLVGNGILNTKTKKIVKGSSLSTSTSTVSGKIILVLKTKTLVNTNASLVASKGRLIKHIKANNSASATARADSKKYKTVRGSLVTNSILEAFTYDRDIRASYENYLPKLYNEFEDISKMMEVEANEVTRLLARINSVIDQPFISTATFTLDRWEKELGIETIPQRSLDSRRHFILAKLRGMGTVTKELLNDIVDAFYFSEVTEIPSELKAKIKLLGKRGIPKNLEDIEVAVTDVIPAHIDYEYEFTWLTWEEVEQYGLTWEEAETYTHEQLEKTFLIDPGYPYEN